MRLNLFLRKMKKVDGPSIAMLIFCKCHGAVTTNKSCIRVVSVLPSHTENHGMECNPVQKRRIKNTVQQVKGKKLLEKILRLNEKCSA